MTRTLLVGLLVLSPACVVDDPDPMRAQEKYKAYQESPVFADGRAMRKPPPGTVPWEHRSLPAELRQYRLGPATDAGVMNYVAENPVRPTRDVLWTGRQKYDTYCAVCHGILGDGDSLVAENMGARPPPSLHTVGDRPDGYLYGVITEGFGYMGSYAAELPVPDRWAVVHYVRALQKSQNQPLARAPADVRERLQKEAAP